MQEITRENNFPPKARIFIAEDETIILEDLKELLIQANYEITGTANSGNEAIDKIRLTNPDLVIMDVSIKGEVNGVEAAIMIQSHFDYPLPVIFLTGFSESTFSYLKTLPDYVYLNKPFQETVLLEAVKRALKKSRPDRTGEQ